MSLRPRVPELGAYVLPGRASDPSAGVMQAIEADRLGLGTVWLSERLGTKDLGTVGGAIAQATAEVRIASGATHIQSRHPAALASLAITLQALSHGRFTLGLGRSIPQHWAAHGLPNATNQVLVDGVHILRRLWAGETVSYDGPLGSFPSIQLVDVPDVAPPPIALTAIGPKSLRLAGTHFDGVLLHAFLTPEAQARAAETVHKAAVEAGRDPAAVRIFGMTVVVADADDATVDARVRARLVTYLNAPKLNVSLVEANGWDPGVLDAIAQHPHIAGLGGRTADAGLTVEQLVEVSRVVPDDWFQQGAAVGTATEVAARLRTYLDHGADEMILHGSTPDLLEPVVTAFAAGNAK